MRMEEEYFKKKIIEMINSINDSKIIEYLYYFIKEKIKAG